MRTKVWIKYLLYILVIGLLVFFEDYACYKLKVNWQRSFGTRFSYYYFIFIPIIFNIMVGLILGFEHFVKEFKTIGNWRINAPKLVVMGVPSLFFSLANLFGLLNITVLRRILWRMVNSGTYFVTLSQVILGYIIITSFYKVIKVNEVKDVIEN